MGKKKIYRSILFLIIGIGIFWLVFRSYDFSKIGQKIGSIQWFWIGVSIALNVLSQFIRAVRWKMLFKPLKYSPRLSTLFIGIMSLAFTNQIIPRGGEIARLGVVNQYEKVPFAKLMGIALIERLVDFIILISIFIVLLIWQWDLFVKILALPGINMQSFDPMLYIYIVAGVLLLVGTIMLLYKKTHLFEKFKRKTQGFFKDIKEGFRSFSKVENKLLFIFQSLSIYFVWLMMLYVIFYAYPPTAGLGFSVAMFTFGLATMAFLLPIQAGMGAWHFVVVQCLLLFGIPTEEGKFFSLLAHTFTNLVYLPLGGIALAFLPLLGRNKDTGKLREVFNP